MISTAVIYSQIKRAQSMKRGLITGNKLQIVNMDYGPVENSAKAIRQEIGVRKVMGANVADIVRLLTFEFSKPVLLANLLV